MNDFLLYSFVGVFSVVALVGVWKILRLLDTLLYFRHLLNLREL